METHRLLVSEFLRSHPEDAAQILEGLPPREAAGILARCEPNFAAGVVSRMVSDSGVECLAEMEAEAGAAIVDWLPLEAAVRLLRRMKPDERAFLLERSSPQLRERQKLLLSYPEGTAGALMDPTVHVLPEDIVVAEAAERVRQLPQHLYYYLYVVERSHRLAGVLNIRELMLARPGDRVESVMKRSVVSVRARSSLSFVSAHPAWREFDALPVVDDKDIFLGVVRHKTLRRLEERLRTGQGSGAGVNTVLALGELYWVGLCGLLGGFTSAPVRPQDRPRAGEGEDRRA